MKLIIFEEEVREAKVMLTLKVLLIEHLVSSNKEKKDKNQLSD